MCCGNGGGGRTNTQVRRRVGTGTTVAGKGEQTWKVTLPDGTERTGLTEHQAVVLTLEQGGGIEPESAT